MEVLEGMGLCRFWEFLLEFFEEFLLVFFDEFLGFLLWVFVVFWPGFFLLQFDFRFWWVRSLSAEEIDCWSESCWFQSFSLSSSPSEFLGFRYFSWKFLSLFRESSLNCLLFSSDLSFFLAFFGCFFEEFERDCLGGLPFLFFFCLLGYY